MAIAYETINDLVIGTTDDIQRSMVSDLSMQMQEYVGWTRFFKSKNFRVVKTGTGITFFVRVDNVGSARDVELYENDVLTRKDVMKKANLGWAGMDAHLWYDLTEIRMNKGNPEVLYNLLKTKFQGLWNDTIEHVEPLFWKWGDAASAKVLKGLRYWIVDNPVEGFTGLCAPGYVSVAGLDPAVYTRHRNYAGSYAAVSDADLITKIRNAIHYCKWTLPQPQTQKPLTPAPMRREIFVPYSVRRTMENLAKAQRAGNVATNDLAYTDDKVTIKGIPITAVPALEDHDDAPVIGVDLNTVHMRMLQGEAFTLGKTETTGNHKQMKRYLDATYQTFVSERERNFIFTKPVQT